MNYIVAGGGTGGHIVPALAIAHRLRMAEHKVSYIGNKDSLEERIVRNERIPFLAINVQKLYRKLTLAHLKFPVLLISSIFKCLSYLKQTNARAIICTGGYISGPIAIAAILKRIDLYIWDGNSFPGLTTRLIARRARAVFTAYDATAQRLPGANCQNLGIPVKDNISTTETGWKPELVGLSATKKIILITGGSQGSLAINRAVESSIDHLLKNGYTILWQTGKTSYKEIKTRVGDKAGLYLFDFTDNMPQMMAYSHLAITRAGAMTIAELETNNLPAILVPLPTAAENHQHYNAVEQEKKGVAMLLDQSKLKAENLIKCITDLEKHYQSYKTALESLPPNNATEAIVNYVLSKSH